MWLRSLYLRTSPSLSRRDNRKKQRPFLTLTRDNDKEYFDGDSQEARMEDFLKRRRGEELLVVNSPERRRRRTSIGVRCLAVITVSLYFFLLFQFCLVVDAYSPHPPSTDRHHYQQQQDSFPSNKKDNNSNNNSVYDKDRRGHPSSRYAIDRRTIFQNVRRMTAIASMVVGPAVLYIPPSSTGSRPHIFLEPSSSSSSYVASAMTIDPKTKIALPDIGEIEQAIPSNWNGIENPFLETTMKMTTTGYNNDPSQSQEQTISTTIFNRLDTTDDAIFYSTPRFVEHVDEGAVQRLTEYISQDALGMNGKNNNKDKNQRYDVLDLCSSWTSHISPTVAKEMNRIVGVGMNAEELASNPVLSEWKVIDLNRPPSKTTTTTTTTTNNILPYPVESFDVVLCQLSIDYLTRPLEVLQDVGRILKKGGKVHILFSNRLFITKAVGLWTGADDIDHVYYVGCYLHFCQPNLFGNIHSKDLSTRQRRMIIGDPLYVVIGEKL